MADINFTVSRKDLHSALRRSGIGGLVFRQVLREHWSLVSTVTLTKTELGPLILSALVSH